MTWLTGWRLSLRLARRDALRSRGRSILVLFMIALPVLAVTAADVVIQTQDVSSAESLDRRLGAADARVNVQEGMGRVYQGPDPDEVSSSEVGEEGRPDRGRGVGRPRRRPTGRGADRIRVDRVDQGRGRRRGHRGGPERSGDPGPVRPDLRSLAGGQGRGRRERGADRQGLRGGRRPGDAEDRRARPDHRGDRGVDDGAQLPHRRGAGRQPGRRDVRRSNLARRRRPGQLGDRCRSSTSTGRRCSRGRSSSTRRRSRPRWSSTSARPTTRCSR